MVQKMCNLFFSLLLVLSLLLIAEPSVLVSAQEVSEEGTTATDEHIEATSESPDVEQTKITILHTNDMHARAHEGEGMGFAKISTLVKQYKDINENTLLLDAGDTVHGTTFATLVRGESIVQLMNEMGYDGMAPGNHDFNYGYDRLKELEEQMEFPLFSANIRSKEDGTRVFEPYIIEEVAGLRLGIFGLTTPETHYKTHPKNVENLVFTDPAEEAREIVSELKEQQVDAIIAVTHLGIDASSTETSIKVAKEAPGIDLIVDGHSHSTLVEGLEGENDTLIVSAGEYTKNLGVADLIFENGELVEKTAKLITSEEAAEVPADPAITALMEEIEQEQEEVLSETIGSSQVLLQGEREHVRAEETNLGNLIADAMLDVTDADLALTNGGGIRASIDIGPITKGEVITVLPFGNYIVTKQVTGQEILDSLENGVSAYPETKGAFPQVAGISFQIDPAQPAGNRVHSVMIQGEPMELDQEYVMATNDFLAAGGDEYTSLIEAPLVNEYGALDEVLIQYIQQLGEVAPQVEGRISEGSRPTGNDDAEVEDKGDSANQQSQIGSDPEIYIVQRGDNLYRIALSYGLTWQELAQFNELDHPHLIYPGDQILVPIEH